METLANGITLDIPSGCFPLSTDSVILSNFIRPGNTVLDLGSGCGTLGLLLCASDSRCAVTSIELDPTAHAAALENIRRNALEGRMTSICADLRQVRQTVAPGSFRTCVSNPPYFSGGPSGKLPLARREDCCTPEDLFLAAAWALPTGGDFYLIHKPERLAQLCGCAVQSGLEPKRLRLIRHKEGGDVTLIALQCKKGAKPGLIWEERCLYDTAGQPTPYYKELYHI